MTDYGLMLVNVAVAAIVFFIFGLLWSDQKNENREESK